MGIQNIVSDWYSYKYDGSLVPSMIDDGGEDMFDQGNQVGSAISPVTVQHSLAQRVKCCIAIT